MAGKCFVIMPYGSKPDADGKLIDFDVIYESIIKEAVSGSGLECIRCDEISVAGTIQKKMFQNIYDCDVAVVDVTSLNPNVFYELGVRHALAESVTVLMRKKGTRLPFNVQDLTFLDYEETSPATARSKLKMFIQNGLASGAKDSPIHDVLNLRIRTEAKPIESTDRYPYKLKKCPEKTIGLITGDIRDVKGMDVWVNSENTNMQMARHFDRSISSIIRYCGAKTRHGIVVEDTIAKELATALGENANLPAGQIVVTSAGELEKTHGVKKIFHAAAVIGQPFGGYTPIQDMGTCVRNALDEAAKYQDIGLRSIVFPLLGTGTARGVVEDKSRQLLSTAIVRLPQTTMQEVWFLTWTEAELKVCKKILDDAPELSFAPEKNLP